MLQVDCLSRPLDGLPADLTLEAWSTAAFGDPRLPWPAYLRQAASARGLWPNPYDLAGISSDNSNFVAYDVPNANLIYVDPSQATEVHYGGHLHDPYDDVELARDVAPVLEDMVRVALTAALATGRDTPVLRVTPQPTRRAVFVGSHTEAPHMGPPAFVELGMALALEGIDVDTIPYGTPVTAQDLHDAAMVVALPVHDYPSPEGDVTPYQEAWSAAEVDALDAYVTGGGLLVLTNSAHRLKYLAQQWETNEDTAAEQRTCRAVRRHLASRRARQRRRDDAGLEPARRRRRHPGDGARQRRAVQRSRRRSCWRAPARSPSRRCSGPRARQRRGARPRRPRDAGHQHRDLARQLALLAEPRRLREPLRTSASGGADDRRGS